jgi:hypothetical protein
LSRRVSLPGADELFRRTGQVARPVDAVEAADPAVRTDPEGQVAQRPALAAAPPPVDRPVDQPVEPAPVSGVEDDPGRPRRTASGRVRHDEKMTVYVTADELLDIEHARLVLRRTVGSAVDRGRLVRAAVAMALADLDEHGDDSELVRRLRDR